MIGSIAVGLLAGLGAQGAGGAIIGGIWGWLIAGVTTAITKKLLTEPMDSVELRVVAWVLIAALAWVAGRLLAMCYRRLVEPNRRLRGVVVHFFLTITFVACMAVGYGLALRISESRSILDWLSGNIASGSPPPQLTAPEHGSLVELIWYALNGTQIDTLPIWLITSVIVGLASSRYG